MSTPVVVTIVPGSPAAGAGVQPGDAVLRVNGRVPRDVIEWRLWTDEPQVELALARQGNELDVVVDKPVGTPLGVEVSSALFDRVRTCDNHTHRYSLRRRRPGRHDREVRRDVVRPRRAI